jgi:hypothetical protein
MGTFTVYFPGQIGVEPVRAALNQPENTLAEVMATGFLNNQPNAFTLQTGDFVFAKCSDTSAILKATNTGKNVTLSAVSNPGEVNFIGAAVIGNLTQIANTAGDIEDSGIPADTVVEYTGMGEAVVGNTAVISDIDGNITTGVNAENRLLTASFASPDVNANIITIAASNVTFTQLNSGAQTIFTPTSGKSYVILSAATIAGTSFAGGGGDRLISLQSNATILTSLSATSAQALSSSAFAAGDAATFPITVSYSTAITSANPLVIAYTGGTTNYTTAGLVSMRIVLLRTA